MLTITPETVGQLWSLKSGDKAAMVGDFPPYRLTQKTFSPGVTLDLSRATLRGFYWLNIDGLTLKGGKIRDGFRIGGAKNITVEGVKFEECGLIISPGEEITVRNCDFTAATMGIGVQKTKGLEVTGCTFRAMTGDAIQVPGCSDVRIRNNVCLASQPSPTAHPDFVQNYELAGFPMSNWEITDNLVDGNTQGIFLAGKIDGLLIARNNLRLGFSHAISVHGAATLEDNRVSTIPGSRDQAIIRTFNKDQITWKGRNVVEGHNGSRRLIIGAADTRSIDKHFAQASIEFAAAQAALGASGSRREALAQLFAQAAAALVARS